MGLYDDKETESFEQTVPCHVQGRKSPEISWERAFQKYSPTNETFLSPVKGTQANLEPIDLIQREGSTDLLLWALSMSDQLYYDNSFLLLSMSKNNKERMAQCLRRNFTGIDMRFFNNLREITLLGQGGFGSVFSGRDPKTKVKYAIKYLTQEFKEYVNHTENLLEYMRERDITFRAMDSPFVVKFYYSLQTEGSGSLFLFFEFCIGDLRKYITKIRLNKGNAVSKMLHDHEDDIVHRLYSTDKDLLDVSLTYTFELFCGLDFLAQCNLVHQDIKPENIMISDSLHLKIGDFGLAYKTKTLYKKTNNLLVKVDDIDLVESSNYSIPLYGTAHYRDLEQQLMVLEREDEDKFDEVLGDCDKYDAPGLSYADEVLQPTFLVDTWAAGIIAINLLLRGFEIFLPSVSHPDILRDVPRKTSVGYLIDLVCREAINSTYIVKGLTVGGGADHVQLMEFIASIFKPRLERCAPLTREKTVYHLSKKVQMKYVDMDQLEQLDSFRNRNFTRTNVFMKQMPKKVRTMYESKTKPKYKDFRDFLSKLESAARKEKGCPTICTVEPGITINNFS